MNTFKNKKEQGFTLIELIIVIAIIAVIAAIVLVSLGNARLKGADAAVKSNLDTVRSAAEIFYLDNSSSYLPSGGLPFGPDVCPTSSSSGTDMLTADQKIFDALKEAMVRGSGSSCYNSSATWAVAIGLQSDTNTSWCIDSSGAGRVVASGPNGALDVVSGLCIQIQ